MRAAFTISLITENTRSLDADVIYYCPNAGESRACEKSRTELDRWLKF